MLNWRKTLPAVEDAGEYAMDQLMSAANSAAKSARGVSNQIGDWASDGYESIRSVAKKEPEAFWGAVTVGMGALIGGLFALWSSSGRKPRRPRVRRTMAVRSAIGRSARSMTAGMGKTRRKRSRRSRQSRTAKLA